MCKDERDALRSQRNAYERALDERRAAAYAEQKQRLYADEAKTPNRIYAEEGDTADAAPTVESPPAALQRHADMHRKIGMELREQAMKLFEESVGHLAAAAEFEASRRRIVD